MLFLLAFAGCEPNMEPYTIPSDFILNFTINDETILNGTVTIDEIGLNLQAITIEGYREQGEDIFFTREFDGNKNFILKPSFTETTESFDIPQGTYSPISFSYNFMPDNDEEDLIEDIIDLLEDFEHVEEENNLEDLQQDLGEIVEDYLEDISPCIMVKGKFASATNTKHIVLVVNNPLIFKILGKNKNAGPEVTLDKSYVNTGNLQFNPAYWLSAITPAMLNNALVGIIDDEEYIFLSKYVNSSIYSSIYNRMEESTTLTINE